MMGQMDENPLHNDQMFFHFAPNIPLFQYSGIPCRIYIDGMNKTLMKAESRQPVHSALDSFMTVSP